MVFVMEILPDVAEEKEKHTRATYGLMNHCSPLF